MWYLLLYYFFVIICFFFCFCGNFLQYVESIKHHGFLFTTGNNKGLVESAEDSPVEQDPSSTIGACDHLGTPATPVMMMPNPTAMQGPPRHGMPPLQPPLGMQNPNMRPFPGPPNMQRMPSQITQGEPLFPSNRFRMPLPFPPRGPPFQRHPSMGPEMMNDGPRGHFRVIRPGFGRPPFQRGRW